jgi:hypothetical protein
VEYRILPELLEQEGNDFYQISHLWKPKELVPSVVSQKMLKDALQKYNRLSQAENELQTLDRAPAYLRILKRMRFTIRRAQFAWRADDLEFLKAIAEFFGDYGTVLQYLKIDQARGRIEPANTK